MNDNALAVFEDDPQSAARIARIIDKNPISLEDCAEILERCVMLSEATGIPLISVSRFLSLTRRWGSPLADLQKGGTE